MVSTILLTFPTSNAAKIATDTATTWLTHNKKTSVTEASFVVFAGGDYKIYDNPPEDVKEPWRPQHTHPPQPQLYQSKAILLSQLPTG